MEMLSAPKSLTPLVVSENSVDVEDVRDEMRTDLIMLNGALKQLNKDWDHSEVLPELGAGDCSLIRDLCDYTNSKTKETDGANDQN